jgi:hypothetical protein
MRVSGLGAVTKSFVWEPSEHVVDCRPRVEPALRHDRAGPEQDGDAPPEQLLALRI